MTSTNLLVIPSDPRIQEGNADTLKRTLHYSRCLLEGDSEV